MHDASQPLSPHMRPLRILRALAAVGPVVVAAVAGSLATTPEIPGWYAGLVKPAFNPPNWVFGPVWTVLFAVMAYAAWRILSIRPGTPGRRGALAWFYGQLVLNAGWSVAFFGMNSPASGLVVVAALFGAILATMDRFRRLDPPAAWLLVPYAAWVAYAGVLNGAIWRLN